MNEIETMMTAVLDCRRVDLIAERKTLTNAQQSRLNEMINRRAQGEPLQYIIGTCDFMGIPLKVDPHVLIPRPETEGMVDTAIRKLKTIDQIKPIKILDLGTGSGNIAISLAKHLNRGHITAVDISREAIDVAQENAGTHGLSRFITFIEGGMDEHLRFCVEKNIKYDMVISNPPYIADHLVDKLPGEVRKEPEVALRAGNDGLKFHSIIIENSHRVLKDDGWLIFEIGDQQRIAVGKIIGSIKRYEHVEFYKDYAGTDRYVCARVGNNG